MTGIDKKIPGLFYDYGGFVINVCHPSIGMVPNSILDQTAKFQAAADAIPSTGGTIIVPAGVYITRKFSVKSKTQIKGAGKGITFIKRVIANGDRGIITNADQVNGNSYIRISDLTLQTTVQDGSTLFELIYFYLCSNVLVENTACIGAGTSGASPGGSAGNKGYHFEGCTYVTVDKNYFENIPDNDIAVTTLTYPTLSDGYHKIINNTFKMATSWAGHSSIVANINHVIIRGNHFFGGASGVSANMIELGNGLSDILVEGNDCKQGLLLFMLSGTRIMIRGNKSHGRGIYVSVADGSTDADATFITIAGNTISGGGQINVTHDGVSAFALTDVFIYGNTIITSATDGISTSKVSRLRICNNIVSGSVNGISVYYPKSTIVAGNICSQNITGFYFENTGGVGVPCLIVKNNYAHENTTDFKFEQPQNVDFVGNRGSSVTGFTITNPTLQGAVPFLFFDHYGTGDPNAVYYASPGGRFIRTDGGASTTLYIKHTSTDKANWAAK